MAGIGIKTHKMLWGRSGNICAFPGCKKVLVEDETESDDPSVIGEEAHIVAQKENGRRGKSDLPLDQRDKYDNLILLCSIHHKIVDDQELEYSVEKLHKFKADHERWVKENLSIDTQKQKDDELYASYIDKFVHFTDLHNWNNWTSWILGASEIFPKQFELLKALPDYIVSRIWPNRYPELESALINFKKVVNDLMKVYYEYPEERRHGYAIKKFYKDYNYRRITRDGEEYNAEQEHLAVEKYYYHVALFEDLILELTRAANYVCDKVRASIFESFRIEEGALLVTRGDLMSSQTFRVEYRGAERTQMPYSGLRQFMEQRVSRDIHIGEGINDDYFRTFP
jgi:hypothetical protein